MNRLRDRVAIVTGAASELGIGFTIALLFSEEGAAMTVADIEAQGVKRTAGAITNQGGRAIACATDISNSNDVRAMIQATLAKYGRLDVLVNNAAHMKDTKPALDTSEPNGTALLTSR